jgi:dipeptidase
MHVGFGPIRINQTVGSMVSHLIADQQTHWLTGTSAPCTGVFKPVWLDSGLPEVGLSPQGIYDAACLWWNHETLHREVVRDYAVRLPLYKAERDELERKFIRDWEDTQLAPLQARAELTARCFSEAGQATKRWIESVRSIPVQNRSEVLYALAWRNFNKQAGLPSVG